MTRQRLERAQLVAVSTLLLLPLLLFVVLRSQPTLDRTIMVPVEHFSIVSAAALAALVLAVLVGIASARSRQPRTVLIAAAFLAIADIFAVHGLMTPGEGMLVKEFHHSLVISARLSLLVGGLLFFMSTLDLPERVNRLIAQHHRGLIVGVMVTIGLYIGVNLAYPPLLDFVPIGDAPARPAAAAHHVSEPYAGDYASHGVPVSTGAIDPKPTVAGVPVRFDGQTLGYAMAIAAGLLLIGAAWRYYRVFALSRLPATAAMAVGMVLLTQSQVSMTLGEPWRLSWWLYHVLMLAGFLVPIAGIGLAYGRGSSLGEIVDGLFLRDTLAKIERSFPEAINALIAATVAKDPYLRGHSRRVCELTVAIAVELGLPAARLRAASYAALLHDVGKIGIPDAILQKTGRLTDDEAALLREHPVRGEHIAAQAPSLRDAAPTIRWHHERLDGSGYPDGLTGDAIPLEARIVAVADVWDALTSDRVYRTAWPPAAARELLQREAGTKLDERCVRALLTVLDRQDGQSVRHVAPLRSPADDPHEALLAG